MFVQQGHLTVHMVMHMGEKNYKCDVCGWYFNWLDVVRRHKKTHTDGHTKTIKQPYRNRVNNPKTIRLCHLCKKT